MGDKADIFEGTIFPDNPSNLVHEEYLPKSSCHDALVFCTSVPCHFLAPTTIVHSHRVADVG
jgi:hypothetical protein